MKLSIGKKITAGFGLALMILVTISLVSYRNITELNGDARWVTHTQEVLQRLGSLYAGLLESQGNAQMYEFLGDNSFRDKFKTASSGVNRELQSLRTLTADNPSQQRRLDKLEPMISRQFEISQKLVDARQVASTGNVTQATEIVHEVVSLLNGLNVGAGNATQTTKIVQEGQKATDEIHGLISEMEDAENQLLVERQKQSTAAAQLTTATTTYGTLLAVLLVAGISLLVTRSITSPLQLLQEGAAKIGGGDYAQRVTVSSGDEVGHLATVFNQMAAQIQQRQATLAEQDWLKTSLTKFSSLFQGQRDLTILCQAILEELASLLEARHSVLYIAEGGSGATGLTLRASYACENPKLHLKPGDGLLGQCVLEKKQILLQQVPEDYVKISSVLGQAKPACVVIQPALFEGRVKAILELASLKPLTEIQLLFLNQLAGGIGIVVNTIEAGMRTEELLKQSQSLSENLQTQAKRLQESERQLQEQQEELKQSNEELGQTNEELRQSGEEIEEKANLLAQQKDAMERANQEIEQARAALEEKARQLAATSKYKSEFLASMSHELRTPLNSLMILSKMLAENAENNLTDKQVHHAKIIHSSGSDLLELINDILDLSKIEAGAVELELADMPFVELTDFVENTFRHMADSKKLDLKVHVDRQVPPMMRTDARRLQQVIKNLLSNAFKFTAKGSVELNVRVCAPGEDNRCETLNRAGPMIAFAVKDTGIGIPEEKQQLIFEAFQQADAGTARKYGGTGLGLSISREIAGLLGGSLHVESVAGQGSTFTLYLPATISEDHIQSLSRRKQEAAPVSKGRFPSQAQEDSPTDLDRETDAPLVTDDRAALLQGDLVLLIIEDDRNFADVLAEFAREKKFKAVVAHTAAQGIALATQIKPAAITIDLHLPDNDGWMVLDSLKHDPRTRHIPVHIISVEEERERSLRLGAVSFLQKPVSKETLEDALTQTIEFINRPVKRLLIVEDDAIQRQNIVDLIGNGDVVATAVGTAAEALAALENNRFDCVVIDLGLPDMVGKQLIEEIQKRFGLRAPPVIVYTSRELTRPEERELLKISESIVIKDVRSPERLLDETALFLHRVQSKLPESKRRMIEHVQKSDSVLSGRKILVVDDDMRNIFAITSALEAYKMEVLYAENGQAGIDLLQSSPGVEAVLMDVMMPDMDGFEAIRRIRQIEQFKKLPIISVTAKAMKGDREKCLQAGASDYITKPVNMDQLRSLLRVWLYK